MSNNKQEKSKVKVKKNVKDITVAKDGQDLASEVAAFASELGLGGATGGAFDDFRPEKAKQRLGDDKQVLNIDTGKKKRSQNKFKPQGEDVPAVESQWQPKLDPELETAIKERTWNEGVGARPGSTSAKSLLGSEDSHLWYEAAAALEPITVTPEAADDAMIETKTKVAERLMESEAAAFEKKLSRANPADAQWLQQVRQSGTSRDKVAAATLLVEESAVANIAALDTLIGWVAKQKGGREVAGHALDSLKELFQNVLLPDRRLQAFEGQPFRAVRPSKEGDKRLLYWWTEDCIKKRCDL